jgi:hypothetical protein
VTLEELEALPENTMLWDRDYGLVTLIEVTADFCIVEVLRNGNSVMTWPEDLSFPTGLQKELV